MSHPVSAPAAWRRRALLLGGLGLSACLSAPEASEAPAPVLESAPQAVICAACANVPRGTLCFCRPPANTSVATRAGHRDDTVPAALTWVTTQNQWTGLILSGAAECPPAERDPAASGAWEVRRPYQDSGDDELERMCQYSWAPLADPSAPPLTALLPDLATLRLQSDVAGTAPLFRPPLPARDLLDEAFFHQIGLSAALVGPVTGLDRAGAGARVAVLDSAPGGLSLLNDHNLEVESLSAHSAGVSSVINRIVCGRQAFIGAFDPPLSCQAEVRQHLALPLLANDVTAPPPNPAPFGVSYPQDTGGYFGRTADVAQAIYDAVAAWQAESPDKHLVINLSLGWEKDYGASGISGLRMPAREAWAAARYAACQGALLIAAAGNRGLKNETGSMFPAGWEKLPLTCPAGGLVPPAGAYAPLVYAAGGVTGADLPLGIARPNGTPRLVSPAAMVSVGDAGLIESVDGGGATVYSATHVVSGTSVAAAALSGTAALVWSMRPELEPWEVMDLIYNAGEDLGRGAEFSLRPDPTGAAYHQHRLSVCGAAVAACDGLGLPTCPTQETLDRLRGECARPAGQDASADMAAVLALAYPELADLPVGPFAPTTTAPPDDGRAGRHERPGRRAAAQRRALQPLFHPGLALDRFLAQWQTRAGQPEPRGLEVGDGHRDVAHPRCLRDAQPDGQARELQRHHRSAELPRVQDRHQGADGLQLSSDGLPHPGRQHGSDHQLGLGALPGAVSGRSRHGTMDSGPPDPGPRVRGPGHLGALARAAPRESRGPRDLSAERVGLPLAPPGAHLRGARGRPPDDLGARG